MKGKKGYPERIADHVIKHQLIRHSIRYFDCAWDQLKKEGRGAIVISLENGRMALDPIIVEGPFMDREEENKNISVRYDDMQWIQNAGYDNVFDFVKEYNPEHEFVGVCEIKGLQQEGRITVKPVVIHRNANYNITIFEKDCFVCGKDIQNRLSSSLICPECFLISYCTKECMDRDRKRGHTLSCEILKK